MTTVAIIGAGVTGLACARALVERGLTVRVFDKGRSAGGRLATRRSEAHTFDLGAQYFTVRDDRFARAAGGCAVWQARIVAIDEARQVADVEPCERWVGTPGMSALGAHLATGIDVRSGHRVDRLERANGKVVLHGTIAPAGVTLAPPTQDEPARKILGEFDRVIITVPAPQALPLVGPALAAPLAAVAFEPCFAVGLAAEELRAVPFDGAFVGRDGETWSPLSWIARDSSKPGRPPGERWVLHASGAWSAAHLDASEEDVIAALTTELARLVSIPLRPSFTLSRRWLLARAAPALDVGALHDDAVLVGGDWAQGGRIEGAFTSGLALAAAVA